MEFFSSLFDNAQQWVFEQVFQPLLFNMGLANFLEDGYTAAGWFLVGCLQIVIMVLVIAPLQRWRPVEAVTDKHAIRIDILYTLIHRLGLFRLALFFTIDPLWDWLVGSLRMQGFETWHVDALWPGVTDVAWVSLLIYLVIFDFVAYWIHRGQHSFVWWWKLHALHHSQRQMTMWSDNRNHLLDDILTDSILVLVAVLIGMAPSQFVAIVAITQLSESLQHANLRVWFGTLGERLWISPRFHRRHHAIGIGHESPAKGLEGNTSTAQDSQAQNAIKKEAINTTKARPRLGGCNFGVLLPWWDMLFGTANFELRYDPTGIRDQVQPNRQGQLRDYGSGFWSQQWRGVLRLLNKA
ncbi:sterol desaturase family protein [Comamonas odontotermitis]|uniref:sterol desaturase family protein n=1 Tax=Comamonas odontotermitis TaxID=379895 RepID=UPI001CC72E25|nr:sterol desaturase family protein [Comamonas odontotermitis]UBB15565.1 sterol desaturase family protein [Comamonas odontotermitis]